MARLNFNFLTAFLSIILLCLGTKYFRGQLKKKALLEIIS